MAVEKSAKKTVGKPFTKGDPRAGVGLPGRSGRKPIAFVQECGRIVDDSVLPKLEAYLEANTPGDAGYRWAADRVLEYGKGKPKETLEITDMKHDQAIAELE